MALIDNRQSWVEDIARLEEEISQIQLGEIPELDDIGNRVIVLEGQAITISGDLAQEVSNRQAADAAIGLEINAVEASIAQEVLDRQSADSVIALEVDAVESALAQEVLDRQLGDNFLTSEIARVESDFAVDVQDLQAALAQEVLDRQTAVAQEIADRQAADNAIGLEIDAVEASVAQEVLDRQAADNAIGLEIDAVESALAQEVLDRQNADSALGLRIDSAEAAIAQEITDRQLEDAQTLADAQGYADSLFAAVSGEVDVVEAALAQEVLDRQAADVVLQDQIDDLDTFTQAIQSDVDDLETFTQAIQNDLDIVEVSLAQEILDRQSADAAISSDVDAVESALAQEVLDRQAGDNALDGRLDVLEAFKYEQVVYVSKNGSDSNSGAQHSPFLTITAALNSITDASPTKRYALKVMPGSYAEAAVALKANVFIIGEGAKETIRITGPVSLGSSFTANSSFDHRSGFHRVTLLSAANFDWNAVQSAAGKLYMSETLFGSTVNMNGWNNAIAQAQFNSCVIFGAFTVSGINVGVFTNNVCFGNVTLNQHPNGGMATILTATGGYCGGTVRLTTTVSDFNRRCSALLRGFWSENLISDGPASYADVDLTSGSKQGAQTLNGGQVIALNPVISHDLTTQMIVPRSTNSHNMGDWGKQWTWNFGYVHASTGTDLFLVSYPSSYAPDSSGKSIIVSTDGAGLQENADGGGITLETSQTTGTGVRGKITLNGREIDVTSKQIKNLAAGTDANDAVNKAQLDAVSGGSSQALDDEIAARIAGDENLQDQIDVEKGRIDAILLAADADKDSFAEIVALINSVDTENDQAFAGYVTSNDARVGAVEGSVAQEIQDRQDADQMLQDQIDDLDTFTQAIQSDLDDVETLASANAADIDAIESDVASLDSRVVALETEKHYVAHSMSVAIASSTEQQYVDCAHIAVPASLNVHVDAMKAHIIRDFTVSEVAGKTRITWVNTFAIGGIEEVAIGETAYISYNYEV